MNRSIFDTLHSLVQDTKIDDSHYNWKKAQDFIAQEFLRFSTESSPDEEGVFYAKTLKKFTDTILWKHLKCEPSDLRRFLEGKITISNLKNHNFESHLKYVEKIWDEFKMFSVCSDLCSSSKTGDLFVLDRSGLVFPLEVKDGDVNRRIIDALKDKKDGNDSNYLKLKSDSRYSKQIKRVERQLERHNHETSLYLNNESHRYGGIFKVYLTDLEYQSFQSEIDSVVECAIKNGTAFRKIDECFAVAAINQEDCDNFLSDNLTNGKEMWHESYSISAKEDALTMPLMLLDMQIDRKYHLVAGNCLIMFLFYPTIFCEQYSSSECQFKYIYSKTNTKHLDLQKQNIQIFLSKDKFLPFGPGLYQRLFGFLTHPSSVAKQAKYMAEEYFKNGGQSCQLANLSP